MQTFSVVGSKHSCADCNDPRCMKLTNDEILCGHIENFPADRSLDVCVAKAITWDEGKKQPIIKNELCYKCGLCMSRCPKGRLRWSGTSIVFSTRVPASERENDASLIPESEELLEEIYSKLSRVHPNYHNIVVRNMMIGLGCRCSVRRIGDVYTRMDAVYSNRADTFGAIEVEFGQDTLSASRGLLDDIAMLYTRYGIDKHSNTPLTVCLHLPNSRQGYWQVVKDINQVEQIPINTISIGALFILLWNHRQFSPEQISYYADYDSKGIRPIVETHIGRQVQLPEGFLGILEPTK